MKHELKALEILEGIKEDNNVHFLESTIDVAIKQLKDLEHYSHYTSGLWVIDRPDLLKDKSKHWQINFWEKE